MAEIVRILNKKNHGSVLLDNISNIRNELCDVSLKVGDTRISAHKFILSAVSTFFNNMFTSSFTERIKNEVELSELHSESLGPIIDYVYSGKLTCRVDDLLELYRAVDFLQILPLKDQLYNSIIMNLSLENCLDTWQLFELIGANRKSVVDFISLNLQKVIQSEDFLILPFDKFHKMLKELVDHFNEQRTCEYADVYYEAVVVWSTNNIQIENSNLPVLLGILDPKNFSRKTINKIRNDKILRKHVGCLNWIIDDVLAGCDNDKSKDADIIHAVLKCGRLIIFNVATRTKIDLHEFTHFLRLYSAEICDEFVYILGGEVRPVREYSPLCQTYNMETKTWTSVKFAYSVDSHKSCILNGIIYIFGGTRPGSDNSFTPTVMKYDIKSQRLKKCASMPFGTRLMSVCKNEREIFLTYFVSGRLYISKYLPVFDDWIVVKENDGTELRVEAMPFSTAYFNTKIYLLEEISGKFRSYDFEKNTWTEISHKPVLCHGQLTSTDDGLFGITKNGVFQFENKTWKLISNADFKMDPRPIPVDI